MRFGRLGSYSIKLTAHFGKTGDFNGKDKSFEGLGLTDEQFLEGRLCVIEKLFISIMYKRLLILTVGNWGRSV